MLIVPSGVKIHLALGHTDMRKGFDSLAVLVQSALKKDPFSGHLFAFRGRKADTIKILFWDGNGLVSLHQAAHGANIVAVTVLGVPGKPARPIRMATSSGRVPAAASRAPLRFGGPVADAGLTPRTPTVLHRTDARSARA